MLQWARQTQGCLDDTVTTGKLPTFRKSLMPASSGPKQLEAETFTFRIQEPSRGTATPPNFDSSLSVHNIVKTSNLATRKGFNLPTIANHGVVRFKSSHTTIDVAATEKQLNCVTAAVGRKSNTTHYDSNTYSALMFKRMNKLSTDTHTQRNVAFCHPINLKTYFHTTSNLSQMG